jgi:hypothetical protein
VAIAAGFLLLGASAQAASRIGASAEWYPLEKGNRWSYQLTKSRLVSLSDGVSQESRIEGHAVEEVTRSLMDGAGVRRTFEVLSSTSGKDVTTQLPEETTETSLFSSEDGNVTMVGGELNGAPLQLLRPMVTLPAEPRAGLKWDAGAFVAEGVRYELRGEVIGFEDVATLAGGFPKCLKVRYTGTVGGSTTVEGMQVQIQEGTIETLVWFAAGVGSVKVVTNHRVGMQFPNGTKADTSEEDTMVLESYRIWPLPAAQAP